MRIEFTRDKVETLHKNEMNEKTRIREELIQLNLSSTDELQKISGTIAALGSLSLCIKR